MKRCGACLDVCPYDAVERVAVDGKEIASINTVLCKGEGACVPVCDVQAIDIEGYTNKQIESMIDAMAREVV